MLISTTVTGDDKPVLTADFTPYLDRLVGSDVTLSSVVVVCRAADSESAALDASASSRPDGSVSVSSPYAQQRLASLVEGADYIIEFRGTFSDGSVETIQVFQPCRNNL